MIYTIEQIKKIASSVAKKYDLKEVYIFGSYARKEATDDSDIDFLIDRTNSKIRSLMDMGALYNDLQESFNKDIDIITTNSLEQQSNKRYNHDLNITLRKEGLMIYER